MAQVRDAQGSYQQILDGYPTLSRQQRKVADFILANLGEVIYHPIAHIEQSTGVSQATIVRFAQAFGYQGFNELRDALFAYYREYLSPDRRMKHSIEQLEKQPASYGSITRREIPFLEHSIESIDEAAFQGAVKALCRADTVYIFGIGPDGPLAAHLHFRLRRMKIRSHLVTDSGVVLFEHLILPQPRDAAVVYCFAKPSVDLTRILETLAERKVPVILITDFQSPLITRMTRHVLRAERGPLGTYPSPLVPMAVTNALILAVAERLGHRAIEAMKELGEMRERFPAHEEPTR
jgi:DNA-binding MurR/RpiR family transcriptional regulator